MIVVFVWAYHTNKNNQLFLTEQGKYTMGVITDVVNRKRGLDFKYQFIIQNNVFTSWEKTYYNVNKGDSIKILYYPSDPSISKCILEIDK